MSKRGEIIRVFVETGFIASECARESFGDSQVSVTVHFLRKHGFPITTEWGVGYRLDAEHRKRLASYPWAVRAMSADERSVALVVELPRSTMRVLNDLADERGATLHSIAAACLERGIDEEMSA